MKSIALIIGVDAYVAQPLTSAVNDARAFRDKLVELELVKAEDVVMLTSPYGDGARVATRENIKNALYDVYTADGIERFYFYFAGHGLLAQANAAQSHADSALVPADVDPDKLGRDAGKLLSVEDITRTLQLCGPAEQLYFIDACRNLLSEQTVVAGPLQFNGVAPGAARSQAVLFAVSPLGKAIAEKKGLGVITGLLIDALDAKGRALVYLEVDDEYAVTVQSMTDVAKDAVAGRYLTEQRWQRKYRMPELRLAGPDMSPIRRVEPGMAELIVHVEPAAAAARTEVVALQRRAILKKWPPEPLGKPVPFEPMRYKLEASSADGDVEPPAVFVDLRVQNEVRFAVGSAIATSSPPDASLPAYLSPDFADVEPVDVVIRESKGIGSSPPTAAHVRMKANSEVTAELIGIEPPYPVYRQRGGLDEDDVRPGAYAARFRIGDHVFNESRIDVDVGDEVVIQATPESSALLLDVGPHVTSHSVVLSESAGELQGAVASTFLPLLAAKLFDPGDIMLHQFSQLVRGRHAGEFGHHPLVVLFAYEGDSGPGAGIRCRVGEHHLATEDDVGVEAFEDARLHRVVRAITAAPDAPSFRVILDIDPTTSVKIASVAHPMCLTVITLRVWPDGRDELAQYLLPLPDAYPRSEIPFALMVRRNTILQQMYRAGELRLDRMTAELVDELFVSAKYDPIAASMLANAAAASDAYLPEVQQLYNTMDMTFPHLPDVEAMARFLPGRMPSVRDDSVPVLAANAREWAPGDLTVIDAWRGRIRPGQPWSAIWSYHSKEN